MLKVNDDEFRGYAQDLAGFFSYHNGNSSPPPLSKSNENTTYFYSTINVDAISYLVKQRNWKLPQLYFNQMQNIVERLKNKKSPDHFGFPSKHVKNGGLFQHSSCCDTLTPPSNLLKKEYLRLS